MPQEGPEKKADDETSEERRLGGTGQDLRAGTGRSWHSRPGLFSTTVSPTSPGLSSLGKQTVGEPVTPVTSGLAPLFPT